jgi:hypothetical protein
MTELDAELGPLALDTINEFGKSVTLTYAVAEAPGYDPDTASTTLAEPPDPKLVKAIIEDSETAKGLIEGASHKLTIAALGLTEPSASTSATFDGTTYAVLQVGTVFSGELPCLYILQVGHK